MPLVIELSEEVDSLLRAEAEREGRPVEDLAAARLAARYERARADARAVLAGPRRPFDAAAILAAYAEKYGTPDLSNLSEEERASVVESALYRLPPERVAEALTSR